MPNGISCAFFAIRNRIYANEQNNEIKGVISDIQGLRSADAIAEGVKEAGIVTENVAKFSTPLSEILGKAAGIFKKCVYPLIVVSGVYETSKSNDKVKTGIKTAAGISTMYTFEKIAETILNKFKDITSQSEKIRNNKKLCFLLYTIRGAAFVAASLCGYDIGKKYAGNFVDKCRMKTKRIPSDNNKNNDTIGAQKLYNPLENETAKSTFTPGISYESSAKEKKFPEIVRAT